MSGRTAVLVARFPDGKRYETTNTRHAFAWQAKSHDGRVRSGFARTSEQAHADASYAFCGLVPPASVEVVRVRRG